MAKERIGIMGGTFNPIHEGHLCMARASMKAAALDRVIFLPDGTPPHKTGIASSEHRWRMVCTAIANESCFEASRMELDRAGTTYTFDTLTRLHELYPKAELCYIIGTDTLMELKNWHRYLEVLPLCTFLVCPRSVETKPEEIQRERLRLEQLGGRFQLIPMEIVQVSSTAIREALITEAATPLLSPAVREYCIVAGLYGISSRYAEAEFWLSNLFQALTKKRFAHTLGVAYAARSLAKVHGVSIRKAEIAALLHDCAKCLPLKDMQQICKQHALTDDPSILASGALMHSLVGSFLAAAKYGIQDPDILRAIACHTTGKVAMTPLDMVVYLADKIEPGREAYPLLNKVRMMAPLSLERAILTSMEGTAQYVEKGGKTVHPQTYETINWLKSVMKSKAKA